jgi:hypothetical protein
MLKDPLITSGLPADVEAGYLLPYEFKFSWKMFWKFTGPGSSERSPCYTFKMHPQHGFSFDSPCPLTSISIRFSFRRPHFPVTGWLMSLAYLDPGNLEADLQQGAYTNYTLVWVLFWSTVIGLILQELSSRLGTATGKDLAMNAKDSYTGKQR